MYSIALCRVPRLEKRQWCGTNKRLLSFLGTPAIKNRVRIFAGAHVVIMIWPFRGQFNDVAIGIPKIDRVDESVIGNSPRLDPVCDAFVHHLLQPVVFDLQRNVQIKVALVFKLERCLRIVKKGKKRPVSIW